MQAYMQGNPGNPGNPGQGPPNNPPNFQGGASIHAQAQKATKEFQKSVRMAYVRQKADADQLYFMFADDYVLCEEIWGVTQFMVQVDDIRSHKAALRRRFANMQYTKQELGNAMKYRRFGF